MTATQGVKKEVYILCLALKRPSFSAILIMPAVEKSDFGV